jgi:hypothetical protein
MDVQKILAELYQELEQIDAAIAALDRVAASLGRRRPGRPPKWLVEARAEPASAKPKGAGKSEPKKK